MASKFDLLILSPNEENDTESLSTKFYVKTKDSRVFYNISLTDKFMVKNQTIFLFNGVEYRYIWYNGNLEEWDKIKLDLILLDKKTNRSRKYEKVYVVGKSSQKSKKEASPIRLISGNVKEIEK